MARRSRSAAQGHRAGSVVAARTRLAGAGHCSGRPRYPPGMPSAAAGPRPVPTARPGAASPPADGRPRRASSSLGDLMLDVVLAPARRSMDRAPTCPAAWRCARVARPRTPPAGSAGSGARTTLIAAVGRDRCRPGARRGDPRRRGQPRVVRVAGQPGPAGSASSSRRAASARFVADRGAADELRPERSARGLVRAVPTRSTCRPTRCSASRSGWPGGGPSSWPGRAGALVSVDLASIGPLLAGGRRAARALIADVAPDLLFATAAETEALLGRRGVDGLLECAPIAVVKRGPKGATVLARVGGAARPVRGRDASRRRDATRPAPATPSTPGSSSAGSRRARRAGRARSLQRAALAGHRAAARQLSTRARGAPVA